MQITTIGLDLAENVFQVHGVDATGQVLVRKSLRRSQMLPFCQIAPNSDPLSLPITTPSDGAMTGAAEPTQRSKPVLAGGEW